MERTLCIVDVETTGLNPRRDRIVEIALILTTQSGGRTMEYETLVRPECTVRGSEIHGLDEQAFDRAPTFAQVGGDILERIGSADWLVGHNVSFDLAFLEAEFKRLGTKVYFPSAVCTCELMGRQSLRRSCEALGIPQQFSHSARHDAEAALAILKFLRNRGYQLPLPRARHRPLFTLAPRGTLPFTREHLANLDAGEKSE